MSSLRPLPAAFYQRPADVVARELLGRWLVRDGPEGRRILRLVETEAYLGEKDAASHAFGRRRTARNESMYLAGGHAYVYFVYGMHWCLNVVCAPKEEPQAVLLRAGAAVAGAELMRASRRLDRPPRPAEIAGGPGRLCAALAVDRSFDGADLRRGSLRITRGEPVEDAAVVVGPRVGIDYAGDAARWPLRFCLRGSSEVSRPRPR